MGSRRYINLSMILGRLQDPKAGHEYSNSLMLLLLGPEGTRLSCFSVTMPGCSGSEKVWSFTTVGASSQVHVLD